MVLKAIPLDYRLWFQVRDRLLEARRKRKSIRKLASFIALYTGLRRQEIVDLRWDDYDSYRGLLYVRRRKKKPSKSPVAVALPVHPELRTILEERRSRKSVVLPDFYILTLRNRPANPRSISTRFAHRAQKEGFVIRDATGSVRRLRFHDLRHLFALRLLNLTKSVEVVRRVLGHRNPKTTLVYLDVLPEEEIRDLLFRLRGSRPMIPGSFCYRREAEKIRRRLYRSLRSFVKGNRDTVRSFNNVYDLYAGTGCLTELVLRALVIKGSYGSLVQVVLVDRRPRPRLWIELGSRLRMMPDIGRRIRIRFEAMDPELKPLIDTLNSLRETVHDHNIRGRRTFRSKSPAFDTVVLRALQEAGKIRFHIQLAEERIRDAERSKAKNVFRAGTLFILDPPRENGKDYYKSKADPDYVLGVLSRHQALVLYVNYVSAIRRVLEKTDLRVRSRYTLYSTGSASRHSDYRVAIAFLVPKATRGRLQNPDFLSRKRRIPGVFELVDPLVVSRLNEPWLAELEYPKRDFRYQKKKAGLLR